MLATIVVIFAAVCTAALLFNPRRKQQRSRHPTIRSKSTAPQYEDINSAAHLLSAVAKLQKDEARWPEIFATLNADHDPQVRTLLLELRTDHLASPGRVLQAVEDACLDSHRESALLSRADILDRAKAALA